MTLLVAGATTALLVSLVPPPSAHAAELTTDAAIAAVARATPEAFREARDAASDEVTVPAEPSVGVTLSRHNSLASAKKRGICGAINIPYPPISPVWAVVSEERC
jgi:hypothetical protein